MASLNNTQLPRTVQPYRLRLDISAGVRRDIENVRKAVAQLWGIKELPNVGGVEAMTHSWVETTIGECINATQSDKSLTASARDTRLQEWRKIEREAMLLTETVQNVIAKYPEFVWCYDPDNGNVTVSDENIDRVINERSTINVPDAAGEHWLKLQTIIEAIKELRKWEAQHDVIPYLIRNAVHCTTVSFAEMWASRENVIDHQFDRYRENAKTNDLLI